MPTFTTAVNKDAFGGDNDVLFVGVAPTEYPWEDYSHLTKRQRQRRREKRYWDNVLRSALRKLRRRWVEKRLVEARRDNATFDEFQSKVYAESKVIEAVEEKPGEAASSLRNKKLPTRR